MHETFLTCIFTPGFKLGYFVSVLWSAHQRKWSQTQIIANRKSLFLLAGTILVYSRSKYTHKHLEQGAIKNNNHILISCSAATGEVFAQAGSLTKARVSS